MLEARRIYSGPKEAEERDVDLVSSVSRRRVSVQKDNVRDMTAQLEVGIKVFAASSTLKLQRK